MPVLVIGLSHHTAPVTVRERFSFAEAEIPQILQQLRQQGLAEEGVILSTCNRVELYTATSLEAAESLQNLRNFLLAHRQFSGPVDGQIYSLGEPHSLEHMFKVASGLDSMVLGETEILGQMKKAYQLALAGNYTSSRLNKAFQKAFNIAKHIRTHTSVQRGSTSVGSVAVELAEKIFNSLDNRQVLVIGAGDTSEKTARALLSRGAQKIIVSNRSHEKAVALAVELGGEAVAFDQWPAAFDTIDIVISSTSAPHYVLDRAKLEPLMKRRRNRPLLLIDIAVPRDIDPEINFVGNVYLYNIDDLQAIAASYLKQRQEEIARCEAIIRDSVQSLLAARERLKSEI